MARLCSLVAILATLGLVLVACNGSGSAPAAMPGGDTRVVRPRADPIEFVGVSVTQRATPEEIDAILGPLFGAQARAGTRHTDLALRAGLLLSVEEDTRTTDQVVARVDMVPSDRTGGTERRTILRVPVGLDYGQTFIDVVDVALTTANETFARDATDARPWHLEYRSFSVRGGVLTVRVDWADGHASVTFRADDPRKSLLPGQINSPAFDGEPYETLAGTVYFNLSRDEFGFFSTRAYGVTSGRAQNFSDFQLSPHNWLRLTVTPRLADQVVDVGFEVVTRDGRRIPFAKAPASYVAGEQFQQNVFRLADDMRAQETAAPGSSSPFESSFYYDDPEGGGVVSVIANGEAGKFRIAYAVESPTHRLRDVDFVAYGPHVTVPDHLDPPVTRCEDFGSTTAVRGRFALQFAASTTVRDSPDAEAPLRGDVWVDVFRAADVTIAGPRDGAVSVASYHFANVDITDPAATMTFETTDEIPAGDYQILGFMDVDGNSATTDGPDGYDPITLPIGHYKMECARQPVTVEFALLLPPDRV